MCNHPSITVHGTCGACSTDILCRDCNGEGIYPSDGSVGHETDWICPNCEGLGIVGVN